MILSKKNRGTGIIEVVVGSAIVLVGIFSILQAYGHYLRFGLSKRYDVQAMLLVEEGVEVVKLIRDASWTNNIALLAVDTPYSLEFDGVSWKSTTTPIYVDGKFARSFQLEDVYRGLDDEISESGTLDPGTKKLVMFVSFRNIFGTSTREASTYITDIFDN